MRIPAVLMLTSVLIAAPAAGQWPDSVPHPPPPPPPVDTVRPDSAAPDTLPPEPPPPPTPEQQRYLDGLRTAGRGVAQLKSAIEVWRRAEASRDTLQRRRAAQRLGGYCGTARDFITRGRAQMQATAYADSTGVKARALAVRIDALVRYLPTCQTEAMRGAGSPVATELIARLQAYETALAEFRAAIAIR